MTLIDELKAELKQMKKKGRYVVSIEYVMKKIELEKITEKEVGISEK